MATIASSLSALSSGGSESNNRPPPQRNSKLLSASLASSGSALASLALGPLVGISTLEENKSNTSLDPSNGNSENQTPVGESSNIILGPNGVLIPRSSILLNPSKRKTFVDQWRSSQDGDRRPAPAVLRIAALPTSKDRQKQREQEKMQREREIEREVREKAQTQKVWGIPKRAFYLGLGEINFNTQMAMLGGWGNGSADVVPLTTPARRKSTSSVPSKKKRRDSSGTLKGVPSQQETSAKTASERRSASESNNNKDDSDSDTSIDLEELAQLNAIINTRRSMEAAQKLASGLIARPLPPLRRNPNSQEMNGHSDSSTPSIAEETPSESKVADRGESEDRQQPGQRGQPERVHFAPLPTAYGMGTNVDVSTTASNDPLGVDVPSFGSSMEDGDKLLDENAVDDESLSDDDLDFDGDENSSRRWSGGKYSKWYTMGMSKGMFNPQYYRPTRRPASSGGGGEGANGELSSSPLSLKLASSTSNAQAENSPAERRGRRSRRPASSRASSVKSRSSSVGSIDEDERERRRQLLRASRPGGTGMLTLPDGTKIRARRVGERYSDEEDTGEVDREELDERMSMDDVRSPDQKSVQAGDKRASDDEGGRESEGSDSEHAFPATTKRRRRDESHILQASPEQTDVALEADLLTEAASVTPTTDADKHQKDQEQNLAVSPEPLETNPGLKEDEGPTRSIAKRSVTMPVGRPVPLSATQAAEMRRRHEEEVGALEAEVLHNIAKAKKAKQQEQQQQQQQQQHASTQTPQRHANESRQHLKQEAPLPSNLEYVERGRSKTKARRSQTNDEPKKFSSGPATLFKSASVRENKVPLSPVQSSTRSTSRQNKAQATLSSPTSATVDRPETPIGGGQLTSLDDNGMRTPKSVGTNTVADGEDINGLTASVSSLRTLKGAQRIDVDELTSSPTSRSASREQSDRTSIPVQQLGNEHGTPMTGVEVDNRVHRSSSSSKSIRTHTRQRLPDLPSPLDLPRKPDMRGYSVVPLPVHQLGRRPLRPREGRFWETDEEEDDEEEGAAAAAAARVDEEEDEQDDTFDISDSEVGHAAKTPLSVNRLGEESDSDDSDMDAEQLAEEERRTALQKKRATTRAAGAELVSGMTKHKPSNGVGSNRMYGRTSSNLRSGSNDRSSRRQELGRSRSSTSLNRSMPISGGSEPSSSAAADGKTSLRPTLSTSVLSTSLDKKGNPVAKISRRRDTWNDFDDDGTIDDSSLAVPTLKMEELELSDGDDLWPPTLDNALGGQHSMSEFNPPPPPSAAARPRSFRRMGSNASNLSSSSSLKHASSPTNVNVQLAMHAAKARAVREKREKEAKERERAKMRAERQNDESMDYGWPRSLQGSSLY